ncbi:LOW QUALITY PROTEIN: uncharacterized protein EMH_0050330 [Eimeria mitis]|uniref:Thioredoxin domain-containing protein n=1 Tax=Eimeria mitis TaxID=44415 RepID=U6JVT2_9EIME|nr:LOW QUALITY PROTEIN: uncharacterized protein EMH_0050330 [Eimeria mitis]CDJ29519.1 hypothetical protein, conserved [Eimeria mitis]
MGSYPHTNSFGGVGTFKFIVFALLNLSFFFACLQPVVGEVVASLEVPPTADGKPSAGFLVDTTAARDDGLSSTAANAASLPRAAPESAAAVAKAVLRESRGHRRMFAPDPIVEEAVTAVEYRCPHCFTYRKTFSQLAMDLRSRFHFAALNCVEDENTMDICGNLGIFALPSIKLFVPPSLHLQLPASEQQPKQATPLKGNLHLEFPGMHDGGALDSFDAAQPDSLAIHSLALPSDDIYLAVQYAARKTQQQISKNELKLTLGGDLAAFEHLRGVPCSAYRWKSELTLSPTATDSSVREQEEKEDQGAGRSSFRMGGREATSGGPARARLYDGIRGLQFILASWVVTEKEHMSFAEEFALVDLLEINSMQALPERLPLRQPESLKDDSARFSDHLDLYREIDSKLYATSGLRTADWRKWIGSVAFGAEALPLPPLEEPKLKHCTTITCSVWMLMHVLAEGAKRLSVKVNAHPKCGRGELFFKRKGQALPIYLLQQQQEQRRPVDLDKVIDTASLPTVSPSPMLILSAFGNEAYSPYKAYRTRLP